MGRDVVLNGYRYYIDDVNQYAMLTDCDIVEAIVRIPETIENLPVRSILDGVFWNQKSLKKIELPDSIYNLGLRAFSGCSNLESVHFYKSQYPFSRISLHGEVFQNCRNLKEVSFESSTRLYLYNKKNFRNCKNLTTISSAFQILEEKGFENCGNLAGIVLGNGATWQTNTFDNCSNLQGFSFLGNISENLPNACLQQMKNLKLRCMPDSNILELAYLGYSVEIIDIPTLMKYGVV